MSDYKPMAMLSFGSSQLVLPVEDAVAAFTLICNATVVEYDWNTQTYKHSPPRSTSRPELKVFTLEDFAALSLTKE